MQASSSTLLLPLVGAATVHIGIAVGLAVWGRSVGRRHASRWWMALKWLPLLPLALALLSITVSSVLLLRAYDAIQHGPAATKATVLAQNISAAMNVTAFLSLPTWLLYGASVIGSLVGSVLKRTAPDEQ